METQTSRASLQCVVVTPERTLLDEKADFIALPMYDGELGVLPGRAPLIGRLGTGELRLTAGDQAQRFYVDGGFAQIRGNVVTVLTSRAVAAEEIDVTKAEADLEAARQPAGTAKERESRQQAAAKARIQLRIAGRATEVSQNH